MRAFFLILLAAAIAGAGVTRAEEFPGPYFGEVIRVIDGDTFEATVSLWPTITAKVSVRLKGFDAPELFRPKCEQERLQATLAKGHLSDLLPEGQIVSLRNVAADSFSGRVVADVDREANVNGVSLQILMQRRGAVIPWEPSEPDIDWCGEPIAPVRP
jgi:endonuclease YncB( thermonuclease family)